VKGFSVYDRVEFGDFDGHATMGYAENIAELGISSPKHHSKLREKLGLDLAEAFSDIVSLDAVSWRCRLQILIARFKYFFGMVLQEIGKKREAA
jgi:hypothetical protein